MTTENPKISAYVPQIIYDRFKEFKEERNLSFSQAAIELFADYFGINLANNSTQEYTGGLPDRVRQLEQIVADLKDSHVCLSNKVDSIQSTGELFKVESSNGSVEFSGELLDNPLVSSSRNGLSDKLPSEILGELPDVSTSELPVNGLLVEEQNISLDSSGLLSEQKSETLNALPHQLEIAEIKPDRISDSHGSSLSSSSIKINYPMLALRLQATEGYVKNKKSTSTSQEFTEWSTKKDVDGIGWHPIKDGKRVYYSPATDLSDEQEVNLRNWLAENQNFID